jgi:hypothetical protein
MVGWGTNCVVHGNDTEPARGRVGLLALVADMDILLGICDEITVCDFYSFWNAGGTGIILN